MKNILNIAAGKLKPINLPDKYFLINLDTMYYDSIKPEHVETIYSLFKEDKPQEHFCNESAFTFMERTKIVFDEVVSYRFLEHVEKDKVSYFIYLMSSCLKIGGEVDIIVPDYKLLAQMLLDEVPGENNWEANDIIITTEMVNHPSDPHASIWTKDRLKYFFELEGRFETISNESYTYDGRDIYLRYKAKRIK